MAVPSMPVKASKQAKLYSRYGTFHQFKAVFIELMKSAISGVEFSFNDIMYKQTDGVAMGSPLGPALANIFVGFYEKNSSSKYQHLPHILGTLMIHLLFFAMKKRWKTFSTN